jgi:GNAT superfamily N-acetyltransferase
MSTQLYPKLTIRGMKADELAFAADCTAAEGWVSENQATLEGFYRYNPAGCLIAEENNKPVGICVATHYGRSGFIGELIVRPEGRGRGIGAALLNHGVSLLKQRGVDTVYLDGVLKAVELYQRNGFRKVCRSWRFSGSLAGKACPHVRRMVPDDLDQVIALDLRAFGADRGFFLSRRLELYPELGYVLMDDERVTGFILGRAGEGWMAAGPWVVEEGVHDPMDLLLMLALGSRDRPISLGILDTHQQACKLVESYGFTARPDSPWRMALGTSDDLGASLGCYAVGSAAKG